MAALASDHDDSRSEVTLMHGRRDDPHPHARSTKRGEPPPEHAARTEHERSTPPDRAPRSRRRLAGDLWGGLAAMLVALPSAIAFGVTIYAPLGASQAATGALAGILGTTALGLVAPALGGAKRLITAPCAPAAAVLSAFVIEALARGSSSEAVLASMVALVLLAGVMQVAFGLVGLGRLIKYMPYPVVSGYLTGVGLYIMASQGPKLLGMPKGAGFWESLFSPGQWRWQGIVVGVVTAVVMMVAERFTKRVPAAILALAAGVLAYLGLALLHPELLEPGGHGLVVGPVHAGVGGFVEAFTGRWQVTGSFGLDTLRPLLVPALTLAVLLSIDTLKTCVVLDTLTRSRHDSNRELMAQGVANVAAIAVGGIPGAGTMGATLVNVSSGAQTRLSGLVEGGLALFAFLVLGSALAWVPLPALAGILMVIGVRMIDVRSLGFLRSRSTILDFLVIVAVVAVALSVSLIAASAVGIVLAVILFVREQIGGSVVRRKSHANELLGKFAHMQGEMRVLEQHGDRAVIFELQGSLFFGTADKLRAALEPELGRDYVVLDMRRVYSVDITAAHVLDQLEDSLSERGAVLVLSHVPKSLPSGQDVRKYFGEVGLVHHGNSVRVFDGLDDAVQWVQDRIIEDADFACPVEHALELDDFELWKGRKPETLVDLAARMQERSYAAGERIFALGDDGDELCLIRRGQVRVELPLADRRHHLATFGRGDFIGEMSFLDGTERSADAIARTDVDLYVLSRRDFDALANEHKRATIDLLVGIAGALSNRLRYANEEIRALE
jgi:SulP family sulfate permease